MLGVLRRATVDVKLSAGIEISHDDVEHLTGESGLALRHRRPRAQLAIGIGQIPVPQSHGRQASAAATNEARVFRRGDACLEGAVGTVYSHLR